MQIYYTDFHKLKKSLYKINVATSFADTKVMDC